MQNDEFIKKLKHFKHSENESESYNEILKLGTMLEQKGIEYKITSIFDGWRIGVILDGKEIGDAVEHFGSYGSKLDKLEIMGFGIRDVLGYLTAEQVIEFAETAIAERKKNK